MNAKEIFTEQHEIMCKLYLSLMQTYKGFETQHKQHGYDLPRFTLRELMSWVYAQPESEELISKWVESGYNQDNKIKLGFKVTSRNRYILDNLVLTTKEESRLKYLREREVKDEEGA